MPISETLDLNYSNMQYAALLLKITQKAIKKAPKDVGGVVRECNISIAFSPIDLDTEDDLGNYKNIFNSLFEGVGLSANIITFTACRGAAVGIEIEAPSYSFVKMHDILSSSLDPEILAIPLRSCSVHISNVVHSQNNNVGELPCRSIFTESHNLGHTFFNSQSEGAAPEVSYSSYSCK